MRSRAWGMVIGVAITAAAGCAGRANIPSAPTTTTLPTSTHAAQPAEPAAQARAVKWVDLKAGDCLADPPPADPAIVQVTVVDCGQPHLAETYLRVPIPVNAALDDVATRDCATGFERYTGAAAAAGPYTTSYLIDSEQDRTSDNPYPSTVICLLQGAHGQSLTGSARR
ncbi:hypothetical protein CRM90_14015 [Mycobacterium sp. ENV421]|uniref:hypothetical protein n=1 Tax=Mycobacterium sp. ENV421 TaxID=1213407 RepID=UPI000C9CF2ED|nr:hypothetical protein [Mycobacterium sp. ENV421]PND57239.1 hypothetical protein CRM90_14015 [Mycobacterium sp. ENV421]